MGDERGVWLGRRELDDEAAGVIGLLLDVGGRGEGEGLVGFREGRGGGGVWIVIVETVEVVPVRPDGRPGVGEETVVEVSHGGPEKCIAAYKYVRTSTAPKQRSTRGVTARSISHRGSTRSPNRPTSQSGILPERSARTLRRQPSNLSTDLSPAFHSGVLL